VVLAAVLLLGLAQLLLPGIAASRLRDRLARDGTVASVSVSAVPAVKLLWGQADHLGVSFSSLHVTTRRTGELLAQAHGVTNIDLKASTLVNGPLTLSDVTVRKRGDQLSAAATLSRAALAQALPAGLSAQPIASGGGQLLLRAQANLLGFGLAADVLLSARDGALVLAPVGIPLISGLLGWTVFSDPHVFVQGVGAQALPDGAYLLTGQARPRP
jgi:hypothetical protein